MSATASLLDRPEMLTVKVSPAVSTRVSRLWPSKSTVTPPTIHCGEDCTKTQGASKKRNMGKRAENHSEQGSGCVSGNNAHELDSGQLSTSASTRMHKEILLAVLEPTPPFQHGVLPLLPTYHTGPTVLVHLEPGR